MLHRKKPTKKHKKKAMNSGSKLNLLCEELWKGFLDRADDKARYRHRKGLVCIGTMLFGAAGSEVKLGSSRHRKWAENHHRCQHPIIDNGRLS